MTPVPTCEMDPESGSLSQPGASWQGYPVSPWSVAEGFFVWGASGEDGSLFDILHHCPTGQSLVITAPAAESEVVSGTFDAMMGSTTAYTYAQIASGLEALGATVEQTTRVDGTCACTLYSN